MNYLTHGHDLHRGFSLVEVLVALVVLGVGMLGMASLYVTTLQANGTAISRTQAVNLASDLAERIRANPNGKTGYIPATAPTAAIGCYTGTACTPAQLASDDLFIWNQQVISATNGLPGGPTTTVTYTPGTACTLAGGGTPDAYSIKLAWKEPTQPDLSFVLPLQVAIPC